MGEQGLSGFSHRSGSTRTQLSLMGSYVQLCAPQRRLGDGWECAPRLKIGVPLWLLFWFECELSLTGSYAERLIAHW